MTELTNVCPVGRAVFGFLVPSGLPKGLTSVNGGQAFQIQTLNVNSHELRVWDREDYTMYCIHCGGMTTQGHWVELLKSKVAN